MTTARFVILEHDHPFRHWDLLLESRRAAITWRLLRPPIPDEPVAAVRLPDHRLQYLEYEGPVSGNRGTVRRVGSGTCEAPDSLESFGSSGHLERDVSIPIHGLAGFHRILFQRTADGRDFVTFV